jgi:dihydroorotate dehydrogenase (NAD+) catalytic subunit
VANLAIELAGIEMKNPVMVASGSFGSGEEYGRFFSLNKLGAVVTKSITLKEEMGNPPPRICETPCGMLNSIGLQNPGLTHFLQVDMAFLSRYEVPVIASVAGTTIDEYVTVIERLSDAKGISAFEVNISCPNIKKGGVYFGSNPEMAAEVTKQAKSVSKYPVIVKLTPNVTSISEIARAVETSGADALSLVNTFFGMAIDVETFRPKLGAGIGGLSGPAIKPLALRMVYEAARAVSLPVIGMGGIATTEDAVEFFLAGAMAVAVGTANFVNPRASLDIIDGLDRFLERRGLEDIREIIGKVRL